MGSGRFMKATFRWFGRKTEPKIRLSMPFEGASSSSSMFTAIGSASAFALTSDQTAERFFPISGTESSLRELMG